MKEDYPETSSQESNMASRNAQALIMSKTTISKDINDKSQKSWQQSLCSKGAWGSSVLNLVIFKHIKFSPQILFSRSKSIFHCIDRRLYVIIFTEIWDCNWFLFLDDMRHGMCVSGFPHDNNKRAWFPKHQHHIYHLSHQTHSYDMQLLFGQKGRGRPMLEISGHGSKDVQCSENQVEPEYSGISILCTLI